MLTRAIAKVSSWLRSMRNRRRMEAEMEEELRFHIDSYAGDLRGRGVPREEALRRARLEFGGIEARKEECRESLGLRMWDEARGNLRSGVRVLRQSPIFTAVAVVSLALGIGANTAIFSLANEVLLRTIGVPEAGRLRLFRWARGPHMQFGPAWGSFERNDSGETVGTPFPYPLYREMQRHNSVMEDLVGFKDVYRLSATIAGQTEAVDGVLVSGNFYRGLGARVEAGRSITPADDAAGASAVATISDAYWARRFGRSADALGKTIDLNRVPVTIVGVNAPEFEGPKAGAMPEVFFPLALQAQIIPNQNGPLLTQDRFWWLLVMGRLKPGVGEQAANAALSVGFRSAVHATIPEMKERDIPRFLLGAGERGLDTRAGSKKPILLLLGVTGLVLAIACANLANLQLARAAARQREIGLRMAMGAGRMRIMRQIMTESLLLALFGGAAGLLLGYVGRNSIPHLFDDPWRASTVAPHMDWRVFAFAFSITVATGILFGIAPAWRATRADVNGVLKETRMSTARPRALIGKALVMLQLALSVVLVVGAGLFLRTLLNLRTTPTGIDTEHIVLFEVRPPKTRYTEAQLVALFDRIAEGLAAVPGAQKVTSSSQPLLAQSMDDDCFRPTGRRAGAPAQDSAWVNYVGTDFFETFGIAIVHGRSFGRVDKRRVPGVAVINRQLAKAFFPGKNPLGRTISRCGDALTPPIEVVGVSADAKYSALREDAPPTMYMPYGQADDLMGMTFEVKTAASLASMLPRMRAVVSSVDKDLPMLDVRTQNEQIEATLSQERVFATLTGGFGLLALILASIGVYGVMAYTVSRRTNEIGIRMALGAMRREVIAMVMRETSLLAAAGIVAGLLGAWAATRLVASMLFGVKPTDAVTFLSGGALLVVVALLAAAIPAWRAARVDPMTALRHE